MHLRMKFIQRTEFHRRLPPTHLCPGAFLGGREVYLLATLHLMTSRTACDLQGITN